ncbi:hypothetical protein FKM82_004620 [Ascaphus truei]
MLSTHGIAEVSRCTVRRQQSDTPRHSTSLLGGFEQRQYLPRAGARHRYQQQQQRFSPASPGSSTVHHMTYTG